MSTKAEVVGNGKCQITNRPGPATNLFAEAVNGIYRGEHNADPNQY